MPTLALASVALYLPRTVAPPYFDEIPVNAGAFFLYALIIGSVALVGYFGFKKGKRSNGVGLNDLDGS